jgi:hypothetical protein
MSFKGQQAEEDEKRKRERYPQILIALPVL